ncbi:unnamed protein product [Durusdinium trenchii]|uniref:Uncharacterized protein n=2 Tax=Durusdinium trenchii TaxID=1381693 RepID=A0ABP0SDJ6_9DINO
MQADPEIQNAVSILQEYIQSCSDFPPHSRILMWNFEKRLQEDSLLQFRATVSFVFKQVPHYFRGSWQTSKKKAQRDSAERVRRYMMKQSGNVEPAGGRGLQNDASLILEDSVREEVLRLQKKKSTRFWQSERLKVEVEERRTSQEKEFRVVLLLEVNTVPHHFAGSWCASIEAATSDACERVLWYFGIGDASAFRGVLNAAGKAAEQPPPQQLVQSKDLAEDNSPGGASSAERPPVEEKTILMQVQNTLQKTFSKDTAAGEKVWVWTYNASQDDPQVFRAIAEVPSLGRTFQGDWCRGKKLAQRNACLAVKAYLEALQSET